MRGGRPLGRVRSRMSVPMPGPFRLLLACAGLAGLVGCSFDGFVYTSDRYGTVRGVNVSLRCRDTYEVFDRPDAATVLVVTNALNEVLVGCLDGGPSIADRQREVARIYLEEKTNRPLCRIVGDTWMSEFHREFSYRCPADPAAASPRINRRT